MEMGSKQITGIYVRVSTDEQAKEGYSIRAQIDKLKNYTHIKAWELYKVYADEGISGKNITERPGINALLQDVKSGAVNNVLVYKIDRLTRSTKDLIELTELFHRHQCSFNSLMESIDTHTASGRMFLKIIGIFAEFERENTIERITLACEKKVKEGYSLASTNMSYGYQRTVGEKIQRPHPEEAKTVAEIFAMYVDGNMSYAAIARNLNHRGVKPRKGKAWHHGTIQGILKNPNYIGKVRYAIADTARYFEAQGKHEPMISEEVFYQAQHKMGKMKRIAHTKRPKENSYFCGILYCGGCGAKLQSNGNYSRTPQGGKIHKPGYRCPNMMKGLCTAPRFSHEKIARAFEYYLGDVKAPFVTVKDILHQDLGKQAAVQALLQEERTHRLETLAKRERELMSMYIDGRLSFDEFQAMSQSIKEAKHECMEPLQEHPVKTPQPVTGATLESLQDHWRGLNNIGKQQFLHTHVEKITAVSEREAGYQPKILQVIWWQGEGAPPEGEV